MKYWVRIFGVVVGMMALFWPAMARADTQDFVVEAFKADYYLSRDDAKVSTMRVQETIVAVFPDFDQNHGILRAIPKTYQGHSLETKVQSVVNEQGVAYEFSDYTENDNLVLKIGDPDTYVKGVTTYVITYTMRGVTQDVGLTQELYWDINGDQWQQPFGVVQATIHLPDDIATAELPAESTCFAGAFGATERDCKMARDGTKAIFSAQDLQPGQTLTIVLSFQPETFAPYKPTAGEVLAMVARIGMYVMPPLLALAVVLRNYWRYGRDPKGKGTIVPEYLPPKDTGVLMSNMILSEQLQQVAPTATLLDMAVKHFVRIYEVTKAGFGAKTTYEVELVKVPGHALPEERQVLTWFFGQQLEVGSRVSLESLKYKFSSKLSGLAKELGETATAKGYFGRPPEKAKGPYIVWGFVLVIGSFLFLPFSWGVMVAGIICFIACTAMPARTAKGVELRDYLFGLKKYMQLAEADRLKALQSPRGDLTQKVDAGDKAQLITLYERLLPYAMLFGIEKEWAKEFAGLYDQPPSWYSGSGTFQAVAFANAMSGFSAASSEAFSAPSSSSGSGFSGGSAGGGGGGGGGGGW